LDTLLARSDVQAVIIAAETSLHADIVEKAAVTGKAIVLQKPMALTMSQADRIVAAVNKCNVPFSMAWQMRVDPQNIEMMHLIKSERLGRVLNVRRRHALSTHTWKGFEDTWHNSSVYNRDIWADDSAHPIDWINALFGAPESVTAEIVSLVNPKVPNDNGIAIFRYPNGPLVEVNCSFTCTAAVGTTEIICETGTIIQNYGDAPGAATPRPESDQFGLKWFDNNTRTWTVFDMSSPNDQSVRISGLAQPIADFLNGRRGPIASVEEARTSLRMVLATYVSSMEGRRVCLDDKAIDLI
jgi:predicted dehydrogenase